MELVIREDFFQRYLEVVAGEPGLLVRFRMAPRVKRATEIIFDRDIFTDPRADGRCPLDEERAAFLAWLNRTSACNSFLGDGEPDGVLVNRLDSPVLSANKHD